MSTSIETRIVELKFDNKQFEAGIRESLSSLKALEQGLKLNGATKGLSNIAAGVKGISFSKMSRELADVNATANKFSLSSMQSQVATTTANFGAMTVAAVAALGTIASQATLAGIGIAKALSLGPMTEGFSDYELKIQATQTIMAGTGESIGFVTKQLKELDIYADETIYSLSDMLGNIGKFTNAGVKLPVAVNAMKGIANQAALAGANTGEAGRAMYNLGQAIGEGHLSLMNWRSVDLANMGTKEFKEQLIDAGVAAGTLKKAGDGVIKTTQGTTVSYKNFAMTLQDKWLTSDVLTTTLASYADKTSDIGKKAYKAAKDVKTFGMMITTLKAASGTGWTDSFDIIIGDLPEATAMFTKFSDVFGKVIHDSANARNKVLLDWDKAGGRTAMIDGIMNALTALGSVIKPIREAFRTIFPAATGQQLADATKTFRDFMAGLKMGGETADKVKRAFAGVFAIFGIGWELIKRVAVVFGDLFSSLGGEQASSLLEIAANFGDFLVTLHDLLKNGKGVESFFSGITSKIEKLAGYNSVIKDFVTNTLGGFAKSLGGMSGGDISAKFEPLGTLAKSVSSAWDLVTRNLDKVFALGMKLASMFGDAFKGIADAFSNFTSGGFDFSGIITLLETGLIAVLLTTLITFIKRLRQVADEVGGIADVIRNAVDSVVAPFEALTGTLETMQNTLRAMTIMQIAIAVGVLAYSMSVLSKIDEKSLKKALAAMAVLFVQLTAAMAIFTRINIGKGMAQLIALAFAIKILADAVTILAAIDYVDMLKGLQGVGLMLMMVVLAANKMPDGKKMISSSIGLVIMAAAIKILASAVNDLAGLSWEELAKGLVGVGALLAGLTLFTRFAEANKGGIAQGAGLILLAVGIKILASAMGDFAKFSWDEIGRGLAAMAGGMAIMAAALMLIPPSSIFSAAAVLIVASSLGMIGDALAEMGGMDWETIGKGLTVLAVALGLIATALSLMPPTSILSAAAILVVAVSLGMLTNALQQMGAMGWEEIAKGLVMLGGALTIIAIAVTAMALALPGAAALVIIVGALTLFLPVLLLLGNMSWEEIAKGLTMLAGVFVIIGVAGALLTPVIPTLIGLAIAITLLGIGMAAAGAGLLMFSTGLTALAVAGTAGVAAVVAIVSGLIGLIPQVMTQIGLGIVAFARVIATSGPAMAAAMTAVLGAILATIRRLTPQIISTLMVMLAGLLRALVVAIPMLVNAGMRLIIGILDGIARNIGQLVTKGTDVIVNFLKGISAAVPRLADQGAKTIIAFVNAVADAIRNNSGALGAAGANMATAIVEGMARGIAGGLGVVTSAAKRLASSALDAAKGALGIKSPSREFAKLGAFSAQGYAKGLDGSKAQIFAAGTAMRNLIKTAMTESAKDIAALQARLKKLNSARVKDRAEIAKTTKALAQARAEYARTSKAYKLQGTWNDEYKKLGDMANKQAAVAKKLEEAKKKLADAVKVRDDYNKSVKDSYDSLPAFDKDTKYSDYIVDLQKQILDTQIYTAQLAELRKRGLNDEMYKELVAKGSDAIPFVTQILDGGTSSIKELNTLGSALASSATKLANGASAALYQAGVDAAAGLVKGLEAQSAALEKQMDKLAGVMVAAIKKALGIRSPSREFMKIGDWSAKGIAEGLKNSAAPVKAAEEVGHGAINAMRKSLSGLGDIVGAEVNNLNPSIRPVLDLTDVKKNASRIDNMLTARPLEVSGAYSQARSTATALKERQMSDAQASDAESGTSLTFIQNNNSPKAISSAETYRNTRNQLSTAKGALTKKP